MRIRVAWGKVSVVGFACLVAALPQLNGDGVGTHQAGGGCTQRISRVRRGAAASWQHKQGEARRVKAPIKKIKILKTERRQQVALLSMTVFREKAVYYFFRSQRSGPNMGKAKMRQAYSSSACDSSCAEFLSLLRGLTRTTF